MRLLVWTWRVVLAVVVGAFVATIYYMAHDVGTYMDGAMPALNLITVIGTALLGIVWAVTRRYWHAFILLVVLGIMRGLFGFPSATEPKLLTHFQSDFLWVSIGVVGLALVVVLTARAVISERALKATKVAGTIPVPIPAQTVTAKAWVAPVAVPLATEGTAVTEPIVAPKASKESEAPESAG
jgi:4-amino-4-deoxy-L-arabinose transferase-like glycosyltransferase